MCISVCVFFLSFPMDFQVTKGKNKLRMMETMIRLVAEASPPIDALEKDELVLHMSAMYKVKDEMKKQPSRKKEESNSCVSQLWLR